MVACDLARFWNTLPDVFLSKTVPEMLADHAMASRFSDKQGDA